MTVGGVPRAAPSSRGTPLSSQGGCALPVEGIPPVLSAWEGRTHLPCGGYTPVLSGGYPCSFWGYPLIRTRDGNRGYPLCAQTHKLKTLPYGYAMILVSVILGWSETSVDNWNVMLTLARTKLTSTCAWLWYDMEEYALLLIARSSILSPESHEAQPLVRWKPKINEIFTRLWLSYTSMCSRGKLTH